MIPKLKAAFKEEFERVLLKKGLKSDDFERSYQDEPMQGLEIQALKCHVTVKRKSTEKQKTYKALGFGVTSWTIEFEQDLNRGVFD